MGKILLIIFFLACLALIFYDIFQNSSPFSELSIVGKKYNSEGVDELGSANLVTAVVVTYRGLDTLGEVTVLFLAAIAVGYILKDKSAGVFQGQAASEILSTGAEFLFPLLLMFGTYVFIHGHLTPGGGFQGGVILASGLLLLLLCNKPVFQKNLLLKVIESLSGFFYVTVGLLGLILAGGFLDNRFLAPGVPGKLLSAGAIPLIYTLIGLKVGMELVGILKKLRRSSV